MTKKKKPTVRVGYDKNNPGIKTAVHRPNIAPLRGTAGPVGPLGRVAALPGTRGPVGPMSEYGPALTIDPMAGYSPTPIQGPQFYNAKTTNPTNAGDEEAAIYERMAASIGMPSLNSYVGAYDAAAQRTRGLAGQQGQALTGARDTALAALRQRAADYGQQHAAAVNTSATDTTKTQGDVQGFLAPALAALAAQGISATPTQQAAGQTQAYVAEGGQRQSDALTRLNQIQQASQTSQQGGSEQLNQGAQSELTTNLNNVLNAIGLKRADAERAHAEAANQARAQSASLRAQAASSRSASRQGAKPLSVSDQIKMKEYEAKQPPASRAALQKQLDARLKKGQTKAVGAFNTVAGTATNRMEALANLSVAQNAGTFTMPYLDARGEPTMEKKVGKTPNRPNPSHNVDPTVLADWLARYFG